MATSAGSTEPPSDLILQVDGDNFNGRIIKPAHYGQISVDHFRQRLTASLDAWKSGGRRGVWLTIPLNQSELIPVAAELGFEFHHTKPDAVTMTKWLPEDETNKLPNYATHNIGVGGFVVNDKGEILLVQEKWLRRLRLPHWKLPGGVLDQGENIWETAMRETFEETGIRTEFVSLLTFKHTHKYSWGIDDLYFACLLRPLNTDITPNPDEIADAKWMNVDDYINDPQTFPGNVSIAEAYKDALQKGLSVQPKLFRHFIPSKPPISEYSIRPCDLSKPCDLSVHDWEWVMHDRIPQEKQASSTEQPKSNI